MTRRANSSRISIRRRLMPDSVKKSNSLKSLQISSPSPWQGRRRPREQNALKREAVILAAARAFRARGYHRTTIDDLAAGLGVTKPTLYLYVSNKEEILFECFRAGLAQIQATLDECERADGPA